MLLVLNNPNENIYIHLKIIQIYLTNAILIRRKLHTLSFQAIWQAFHWFEVALKFVMNYLTFIFCKWISAVHFEFWNSCYFQSNQIYPMEAITWIGCNDTEFFKHTNLFIVNYFIFFYSKHILMSFILFYVDHRFCFIFDLINEHITKTKQREWIY